MFASAGDACKCQEYLWAVKWVVTAFEGLFGGVFVAVPLGEATFPETSAVAFHARGAQLPGAAVAKSSRT